MAGKPPLIQAGDVAIYATQMGLSNAVDNGLVQQLVGEVSDMARRFCSRDWWINPYSEQYYGKNSKVLLLKNRPITAITSITVASGGGNCVLAAVPTDPNGNPIPSSFGYWFDEKAIYLGACAVFPDSTFPNVYVQYSAGYASLTAGTSDTPDYASIPQDLKMALIKETVFRYEESKRVGIRSETEGQGQTSSFNTGPLDPQCAMILKNWRRTWSVSV
jgi:hypothetical protein